MPTPKMKPPSRLPSQKLSRTKTSQSLKSAHFRYVNPTVLITIAIATARVASACPVMKGSRNARTKQKRVRCMMMPMTRPNPSSPARVVYSRPS